MEHGQQAETVLTFGFGSNMSLNALNHKGVRPLRSFAASLLGFELFFDAAAGMAHVRRKEGACVYGVVHELTKEENARLQQKEGGDKYYALQEVEVLQLDDNTPHRVLIYAENGKWKQQEGKPSARYLMILIEGAEHFKLPQHYVEWLKQVEAHPEKLPEQYCRLPCASDDAEVPRVNLAKFRSMAEEAHREGRILSALHGKVVTVNAKVDTSKENQEQWQKFMHAMFHGKDVTQGLRGTFYYPGLAAEHHTAFIEDLFITQLGSNEVQLVALLEEVDEKEDDEDKSKL